MSLLPAAWHLWAVAALLLGALEVALSGFVMLWLALGAVAAALVAGVGFGLDAQLVAFTLVSVALFAGSRTVFRGLFMRRADRVRTGTDAMLGEEALVTDALAEGDEGTVRIHGELWKARSLAGAIGEGERVVVEQVDGLKLWVRRRTPRALDASGGERTA